MTWSPRNTDARRTVLSPGSTVANIVVTIRASTMAEWMVARVTMKAFLQVPPTNTIARMRTRLARAIARRSIHSRHPRARDGRLEYIARANEIEPAASSGCEKQFTFENRELI
jgi:hypothetical protein